MLSVSMEQGMMDMADMAKIEAERKVLPLSVLKQKCRMMSKEAAGVDGYVCAVPVIDEYMVYAAKAGGEKAVVIDVSLVDRERAVFFSKLARFVGISCVFQVHTFNRSRWRYPSGHPPSRYPMRTGPPSFPGRFPGMSRASCPLRPVSQDMQGRRRRSRLFEGHSVPDPRPVAGLHHQWLNISSGMDNPPCYVLALYKCE